MICENSGQVQIPNISCSYKYHSITKQERHGINTSPLFYGLSWPWKNLSTNKSTQIPIPGSQGSLEMYIKKWPTFLVRVLDLDHFISAVPNHCSGDGKCFPALNISSQKKFHIWNGSHTIPMQRPFFTKISYHRNVSLAVFFLSFYFSFCQKTNLHLSKRASLSSFFLM